ncbi:MAG: response regulator [Asticcacaulis sp.]
MPANASIRAEHILIVDDNRGDTLLLTRALKAVAAHVIVEAAPTGERALLRLRGEAEYAGQPLPELVLLDCRLPRLDGFQVLDAVRADPSLRPVRVVMMSGLVTAAHLEDGERRGASGHVQKPDTAQDFARLAAELVRFLSDAQASGLRFPENLPDAY